MKHQSELITFLCIQFVYLSGSAYRRNIHLYAGCNIGSKTLLAERGKLPLTLTCLADSPTCPATLLNKGELQCKDSVQNITCQVGQVWVLFCLSIAIFCLIHLQLAMRQKVMLHAGMSKLSQILSISLIHLQVVDSFSPSGLVSTRSSRLFFKERGKKLSQRK